MTEVDMAAHVSTFFAVRGFDVFHEVNLNGRCDLVARTGRIAYAIECKQSASLTVIAQAIRHIGRAHCVYVAVPRPARSAYDDFMTICSRAGVGVLLVHPKHDDPATVLVNEMVSAPLNRWLAPSAEAWLRATLTPDHMALASEGGSRSSKAWTGAREFAKSVWILLNQNGPMTVREIAAKLAKDKRYMGAQWYFRSDEIARRNLHTYLSRGWIPCVETVEPLTRPAKWKTSGPFRIS